MTSPNELRLGNFISHNGNIKKVDGIVDIEFFGMQVISGNEDIDLQFIEPIRLTVKELEKIKSFGRTTVQGEDSFFNGDNVLIRVQDMALFLHNEVDGSVFYVKTLSHLHQLQNIYFAITGRELKIGFTVETQKSLL